MSRIGKLPVTIPENVNVELSGKELKVKGKHGELKYTIPNEIEVVHDKNSIVVKKIVESRLSKISISISEWRKCFDTTSKFSNSYLFKSR